jgi:RND family efflux transporter MFP subunit
MGPTEPLNPYQAPRAELDATAPTTGLAPSLQDAIAGRYDFTIGDVMDESWRLIKGMKASFWGAAIVIGLIYMAVSFIGGIILVLFVGEPNAIVKQVFNSLLGVLMTPFMMGLQMMCVRRALGAPVSFATAFSYFPRAGTAILASLLVTLLIHLGIVLLIIPGIYLAVAYALTTTLVCDRKLGAWDAMETSRDAITHQWWRVFGLMIVVGLLTVVSAVGLLIPLIWTIPWLFMSTAVLYRRVFYAAQTAAVDKPKGVPVTTAAVLARDLDDTLMLTGTLRPRAQVQVVAEVQARLQRVLRDEGSRVGAGETLALLDDTDFRLSLDRAKAALAVADANKAHAVAEKERADNLIKTGGITDKDHLTAQVALQVAEAQMAQVRAEVAIAAQQFARTTIKAPFGGRVARRMADPGTMLANGTPLFTVVDDAVLEFRASVPSADYGKVHVGAAVDVTVDTAGSRPVQGKVARVTPLVDERTRSFEVVVQIPGRDDLVGGLFARASVTVGKVTSVLVVPPAALVRDGSDPLFAQAFVVTNGKAERKKVTLGVETSDAIQVKDGLKVGDIVVLDPPVALSSGAPVELQAARK